MEDITKKEESRQDADYFVQVNELYVEFRCITKQLEQAIENAPNVDEDSDKENDNSSELTLACKTLCEAILGCLDAKLDGLPVSDLHYYRLLGMKGSILAERSKILAAMDEDEESFKVLDEALSLVMGFPPRPEISYVALRMVNHFAYTLSVDGQFEKAKQVLLEGERLYEQIDEHAIQEGFLTCDDLFMPECGVPERRDEGAEYLERLATNNKQMLSFVHGRLGDWPRFARTGHAALRRQLERREGDALTWAARAARLAGNFVSRGRYREALTHLAAATNVLETYEADLRSVELNEEVQQKLGELDLRVCDIGRAWTKYALHLLDESAKDEDEKKSSGSSASSSSSEEDSDIAVEVHGNDQKEQGDTVVQTGKEAVEVIEVPVGEEGDHQAVHAQAKVDVVPAEDLQEQGDTVVQASKDAVEVVEVPVGEEGDHIAVHALGKVEEVDDKGEAAVKEGAVDNQVGITEQVETPSEVTPLVDENVEVKDSVDKDAAEDATEKDEVKGPVETAAVEKDAAKAVLGGAADMCGLHATDAHSDGSDDEDDGDEYSFPTLDLDYILDAVPCGPVDSAEKARSLGQHVTDWSERVMALCDVRAQPELHVAAALDHVELLRYLANYMAAEAAYQLHRSRASILEQVCDQLKEAGPEAYRANCDELFRDLADVQLEMMTLNLRRLDHASTAQELPPQ